jgi:hypothetical protein
MSMALPFLKLMLGSGHFKVLGAWWEKSEDAAVVGLHRFFDLPLSSFLFFGDVFIVALAFSLFRTLVSSAWLLYNIYRSESLFRGSGIPSKSHF